MHEWFRQIWDEREDEDGIIYCFETGYPMERGLFRGNTCCYHHVLEKEDSKFPQYKMVKKNIVIILPDRHTQVHTDIDKTPRVKAYREELLNLHYENKLKDEEDER